MTVSIRSIIGLKADFSGPLSKKITIFFYLFNRKFYLQHAFGRQRMCLSVSTVGICVLISQDLQFVARIPCSAFRPLRTHGFCDNLYSLVPFLMISNSEKTILLHCNIVFDMVSLFVSK